MQRKPTDAGVVGDLMDISVDVAGVAEASVLLAADDTGVCGSVASTAAGVGSLAELVDDDEDAPAVEAGAAARLRTMPERMLFCDGLVDILVTLGLAISAWIFCVNKFSNGNR